jgi:hypothetical protein
MRSLKGATRRDVRDVETKAKLKTGFIEWRLGVARFEGFGVVEEIGGCERRSTGG